MDNYKDFSEKNPVEIRNLEEKANKRLLSATTFFTVLTMIAALALIGTGILLAKTNPVIAVIVMCIGVIIVVLAVIFALKIEHDTGYYECPECKKRYVPTMKAVVMAPHYGRTRKMKCPYCNKKGYHKKVLSRG